MRYCVHKSVLQHAEVLIFPLHFSAVADLIHKGILLMDPQREVGQLFRNQTEQVIHILDSVAQIQVILYYIFLLTKEVT